MLSNTAEDAGKFWRSPSEKSAYTRSSSSSREMAKARISRSDNSLKFFMARLDYQCAGLVPNLEDLTAEGAENGRRGSGVLCLEVISQSNFRSSVLRFHSSYSSSKPESSADDSAHSSRHFPQFLLHRHLEPRSIPQPFMIVLTSPPLLFAIGSNSTEGAAHGQSHSPRIAGRSSHIRHAFDFSAQ